MKGFKSKEAGYAVLIGGLCSLSYLAVYVVRNVLGSCTPQMLESGGYSTAQIGRMSSVFFVVYALGQLINGVIGDHIRAKYMIAAGLLGAGVCNGIFLLSEAGGGQMTVYSLSGYFLSMIYAPMSRVVAENTTAVYAARCSLGYTVASFLGSPAAGLLAGAVSWRLVFGISGGALAAMAVSVFVFFGILERKEVIRQYERREREKPGGGAAVLIRRRIIRFTLLSAVTGVIRTSVIFWLPTYLNQYLGYSTGEALKLYAAITFFVAAAPFAAVFLLERLRGRTSLSMAILFAVSILCFFSCYFVRQPAVNSVLLTAAIIGSNGVSSLIWSRYCPSLYDTGLVSAATGYLDFVSYLAAALANLLFAHAVAGIGWGNLILLWCGLLVGGLCVSLYRENPKQEQNLWGK